jgi:glycogen synthase
LDRPRARGHDRGGRRYHRFGLFYWMAGFATATDARRQAAGRGPAVTFGQTTACLTDLTAGATPPGQLRLLTVTPRYFPYTGGVESHVYEVSRRLARAGVQVRVLTTDPSGQLPAYEQQAGVEIVRVWAWPARGDLYFAPAIAGQIQNGRWDIVHVQSYHTLVAPLAMAAAVRAQLPYVVTFHGGGHSSALRRLLRGTQRDMLRPLLARAARLVALAPFEIDWFSATLRLPRSRFALIPNGADLPRPLPVTADPNVKLIASVGRLERYKGHQRILAALPAILEQEPRARLWIVGLGPYESALRQQARHLGVEQRVDIRAIAPTEREAMATELSRAALVVLLSEFETQPIAVLEALALGRPALVADSPGLSDLARRGWARAIPLASTPQQVADAVLAQLRQPLKPVDIELPTWDRCANDLLGLYDRVRQEHRCVS